MKRPLWPTLNCALLSAAVWALAGVTGSLPILLVALGVSSFACFWVSRRFSRSGQRLRWSWRLGVWLSLGLVSYSGFGVGLALYPWYVQRHLAEYEQVAEEARRRLQASGESRLTWEDPRWELMRAVAVRGRSGQVQVQLIFAGGGRRSIIHRALETHVGPPGVCLVEFAPNWFWDRACPS